MPDEVQPAMMQMRKLSFDGFVIPYQEINIECGIDDHEHKYPHTAGAANEKNGRKLHLITVKTQFDENFIGDEYAALYPGRLNTLLEIFQRGDTCPLVTPNRGEFQAYCTNWSTTLSSKILSGEAVVLKFKEDRNEELLAEQRLILQRRSLSERSAAVTAAMILADWETEDSIWDDITNGVNGVLGYMDQGELYGNLVAAKIEGLTQLIRTADETINALNDPANHAVLDALHRLWESVQDVADDLSDTGNALETHVMLMDGTITDAAIAIYRDGSRGGDLLGLNVIRDPLLIPAGTVLNFYPD